MIGRPVSEPRTGSPGRGILVTIAATIRLGFDLRFDFRSDTLVAALISEAEV
jgi:hypothetical protein